MVSRTGVKYIAGFVFGQGARFTHRQHGDTHRHKVAGFVYGSFRLLQCGPSWRRHELSVSPETGCGIDNLEIIKRVEDLKMSATTIFLQDEEKRPIARSVLREMPNGHIRVEATFGLPNFGKESDSDQH